MAELIVELDKALELNDLVLLAYDVFNVTTTFTKEERYDHIKTLANFYGEPKSSMFQGEMNTALAPFENRNIGDATINQFFDEAVKREQIELNSKIKDMVRLHQLTSMK